MAQLSSAFDGACPQSYMGTSRVEAVEFAQASKVTHLPVGEKEPRHTAGRFAVPSYRVRGFAWPSVYSRIVSLSRETDRK